MGLLWLATGVVGGLPFYFSGYFNSFIDCVFEASSGFTTTGATILTNIEALPYGILFWRAFTHWLGGMGVLILATASSPPWACAPTTWPRRSLRVPFFQTGPQAVPDLQDSLPDVLCSYPGRGHFAEDLWSAPV